MNRKYKPLVWRDDVRRYPPMPNPASYAVFRFVAPSAGAFAILIGLTGRGERRPIVHWDRKPGTVTSLDLRAVERATKNALTRFAAMVAAARDRR